MRKSTILILLILIIAIIFSFFCYLKPYLTFYKYVGGSSGGYYVVYEGNTQNVILNSYNLSCRLEKAFSQSKKTGLARDSFKYHIVGNKVYLMYDYCEKSYINDSITANIPYKQGKKYYYYLMLPDGRFHNIIQPLVVKK